MIIAEVEHELVGWRPRVSSARIVYITAASFPARKASSVQVMNMCAALAATGAAVKLIARDPGPERLTEAALLRWYGVSPEFSIEQRPLPRAPRAADVFQAQAVWRERRHGRWICYARGRDVVAPWLAIRCGAQAIVELHGRPASRRERWLLTRIGNHPRGHLAPISQTLRQLYWDEYRIPISPALVAPDGVNLERFRPDLSVAAARERLGLDATGAIVCYVGGLYEGRGLATLFAAMLSLDASLIVVGGRTEAEVEEWRARAQAQGVHNVEFVGYQPPRRVPLYLAAADILAMPYTAHTLTPGGENTSSWMSPLKMYEYLAAGRPIVATSLPAVRMVLQDENTALLVPPDDPHAMAGALKRLLADADLAARLAAAARAAAANHTWTARARRLLLAIDD